MIRIYGISNCDTVQKAIKWLDAKKKKYVFHNYKELGIDKATLELWLEHFRVDKLVNLRSTTYKELTESDRASIADRLQAIELMMKHNSIIKRPVWDLGKGRFYLGWNEKELSELIG